MRKILFLADQPQRLQQQTSFIHQLLKIKYPLKITLLIACEVDERLLANLSEIKVINLFKKNTFSKKVKQNTFLYKFIKDSLIGQIIHTIVLLKKMRKYLLVAKRYIDDISPDIIFLNGDRAAVSFEQAFLKIAFQKNIKTIVPYTSVISDGVSLRELHYCKHIKKTILDQVVFYFYKNITKTVKDRTLLFYDAPTTIILSMYGTLSKNPWMIGNGLVDIVCLDTKMSYEKYKLNIEFPEKFRVIGDIEYDAIFNTINEFTKNKFSKQYDIKEEDTVVILAVPQLAEHLILSWEDHWKEIEFILNSIEKLNYKVFLSLHPKSDYKNYKYLESKFNCKILEEELKSVLVCADIFIAVNSSTVLWSVMLGVKTIILNYFNLDISIFSSLLSITYVNDRDQLSHDVSCMNSRVIDFTRDWELLSKNDIFDGKTIERYFLLLEETES